MVTPRLTPPSVLCAFVLLAAGAAIAADDVLFRGVALSGGSGTYLVRKQVSVRAAPKTEAEQLSVVEAGERLESPGKAKGTDWYAVAQDGKELGFIYGTALLPVIDGSLDDPLSLEAAGAGGVACKVRARFSGKSEIADVPFETSDYDVEFDCTAKGKRRTFGGFMFLTEGPYNLSRDPLHQISVDLLDLGTDEEPPSVIAVFDRRSGKVAFDGVTPDAYAGKPDPAQIPAASVPEALMAALRLAVAAWNAEVWKAVFKD